MQETADSSPGGWTVRANLAAARPQRQRGWRGLTSYILCDHMREPLNFIFTALAELSICQIAERQNATGMAW